jgi:hypothetical protein
MNPTAESHEFIILLERTRMRTGPEIPLYPANLSHSLIMVVDILNS